MDKVLKRRLIGASILIALAVIFLPMLLVGPEPDLDDRSLRQPLSDRPDEQREIRRIPLNPELARVPDEEPEPAAPTPRTITLDPPESSSPARAEPPRRDLPEEIVLNPSATTAEPEPAESAPAAESESRPTPDPEPEAPAPPPRAEPQPAPATASDGRWVVQVASFGSLDSSRATRERLEALGHPVITDEVVRGDTLLYRLRTGPYANASAAETARGQIAATVAGVQPIVREIEVGALEAEPGFAVQVGSFASLENAERETARLRELGFEAFRMSDDTSGRAIWKVLVGTVSSRAEAEALRARLTGEAGVEGLVVSHP
jgi:DedD protein